MYGASLSLAEFLASSSKDTFTSCSEFQTLDLNSSRLILLVYGASLSLVEFLTQVSVNLWSLVEVLSIDTKFIGIRESGGHLVGTLFDSKL